jgi:hypothetical protein
LFVCCADFFLSWQLTPFAALRNGPKDTASCIVATKKGLVFFVFFFLSCEGCVGGIRASPAMGELAEGSLAALSAAWESGAVFVSNTSEGASEADLVSVTPRSDQELVPPEEAAAVHRRWAQSSAWHDATLENNEWTRLPLPVLDIVLRMLGELSDAQRFALVCKCWSRAVHKVPFSRDLIAEHVRVERHRQELEVVANRRNKDVWHAELRQRFSNVAAAVAAVLLPTLLCWAMGITGAVYFAEFGEDLTTIPECPYVFSLAAALFSGCAFWILIGCLFPLYACAAARTVGQFSWRLFPSIGRPMSLSWLCFAPFVGIWSSAAACVHYSNACLEYGVANQLPVRNFAATSLAFGLLGSVACVGADLWEVAGQSRVGSRRRLRCCV